MARKRVPPISGNILLNVDAYSLTHYQQYPSLSKICTYLTFRRSPKTHRERDDRIVWFGIRYIIERYIVKKITNSDIDELKSFCEELGAGFGGHPFPEETLRRVVTEFHGRLPLRIWALPEGTVVYPGYPVLQIEAEGEYAPLATLFEALFVQSWYPTLVATLARRLRDVFEEAFARSADDDCVESGVDQCLRDWGLRGASSNESATIAGSAFLLSFRGVDTVPPAHYVWRYRGGELRDCCIPAMSHNTVITWKNERDAFINMIRQQPSGRAFAVVLDSYDFDRALLSILPTLKDDVECRNCCIVLRPDSGDPIEVVIKALEAAHAVFGSKVNTKGYRVLRRSAVVLGDGLSSNIIEQCLESVLARGFSASNVSFGFGSGLVQRDLSRDVLGATMQVNEVVDTDGSRRDVNKQPREALEKASVAGKLGVHRVTRQVFLKREQPFAPDLIDLVYDGRLARGRIRGLDDSWDELRARLRHEWQQSPRRALGPLPRTSMNDQV